MNRSDFRKSFDPEETKAPVDGEPVKKSPPSRKPVSKEEPEPAGRKVVVGKHTMYIVRN